MLSDNLIITQEELDSIDYNIFLSVPITFHEYKIRKYLDELTDPELKPKEHKLASLLSLLFIFHLQINGTNPVFEPQVILGNKRSLLPEDFDDKINECLLVLCEKIENPFLLSRICDVVWCNDKKNRVAAIKAIDSYAEMINEAIEKLIVNNECITEDDLNSFIFIRVYVSRALFIKSRIYPRKSPGNPNLTTAIHALYNIQNERLIFEGFNNLTHTMMNHFPGDNRLQYAKNAEGMANAHRGKKYYEAVKALYLTSAGIYEKNGDQQSAKRCRLISAEITIDVANARQDKMGKAAWLRTAIEELRKFGGDGILIGRLKAELADLREEAMDDYVTISNEVDISDLVENVTESITNRSLSYIFKQVIADTPIENIDSMREEVQRIAGQSFFSSLLGMEVHDEAGRKVHKAPPLDIAKGIDNDAVIDNYLRSFEVSHQIFVNGIFEPARYVVSQEHNLTQATFREIAAYSPLIKPEFRDVFCLGFYRLWQGDYVGASYILIPQMEGLLRRGYELSGKDATRYLDKGLEESTSISVLLDKCKSDLESIFTEELILTIDLVFNRKGGPILRHKLAHGNMHTGVCYSETTTYACLLVFYLCAYPLQQHFDEFFG